MHHHPAHLAVSLLMPAALATGRSLAIQAAPANRQEPLPTFDLAVPSASVVNKAPSFRLAVSPRGGDLILTVSLTNGTLRPIHVPGISMSTVDFMCVGIRKGAPPREFQPYERPHYFVRHHSEDELPVLEAFSTLSVRFSVRRPKRLPNETLFVRAYLSVDVDYPNGTSKELSYVSGPVPVPKDASRERDGVARPIASPRRTPPKERRP